MHIGAADVHVRQLLPLKAPCSHQNLTPTGLITTLVLASPIERMKRIPTIVLAAVIGVAVEAALCVISVVSVLAGGVGPCGPTGDAPSVVRIIHQPGFWIGGFLVEDSSLSYLPLAVVVTTVLLSILAFIVLRFGVGRNKVHRPNDPLESPAIDASNSAARPNRQVGGGSVRVT